MGRGSDSDSEGPEDSELQKRLLQHLEAYLGDQLDESPKPDKKKKNKKKHREVDEPAEKAGVSSPGVRSSSQPDSGSTSRLVGRIKEHTSQLATGKSTNSQILQQRENVKLRVGKVLTAHSEVDTHKTKKKVVKQDKKKTLKNSSKKDKWDITDTPTKTKKCATSKKMKNKVGQEHNSTQSDSDLESNDSSDMDNDDLDGISDDSNESSNDRGIDNDSKVLEDSECDTNNDDDGGGWSSEEAGSDFEGDYSDDLEGDLEPKETRQEAQMSRLKAALGITAEDEEKARERRGHGAVKGTSLQVQTIASQKLGNKRKAPEVIVYERPKKKTPKARPAKSRKPNASSDEEGPEFDMKRARYEVERFGIHGMGQAERDSGMTDLLVKMGAKAPKKQCVNYREFQVQRKQEEVAAKDKRELDRKMGFKVINPKKNARKPKDKNNLGHLDPQIGSYRSGVQVINKQDIAKVNKAKHKGKR